MILMLYLVDMSNLRVGRNILVNRLSVLNNQIKHGWMNCSLNTYKVKCETLFLPWTAHKRGIVIDIHWQIYFFKCKPQFYNEIINTSNLKKSKNYFILCLVVQPGLQSPSYCCGSCTTHRYLVTHTILHTLSLSLLHTHTHFSTNHFNNPLDHPAESGYVKFVLSCFQNNKICSLFILSLLWYQWNVPWHKPFWKENINTLLKLD